MRMTTLPDDSFTDLIATLVSIDSVNPALDPSHAGEGRLARFIKEWSEGHGLTVQWLESTPGRPSLIITAEGSGGGRNLLLNGHLDTVGVTGMDQPFEPRVENGRLYGRGAFDMKASLAACLMTLVTAKSLGLKGDVAFTAVADEEDGSIGTEETLAELGRNGRRFAAAVVLEPSELELQVAHRGFAVLDVDLTGKASHTAKPEAGVNALTHLGRLLAAVERVAGQLTEASPHALLRHGSLQPVLASGGQELYTTPARATVALERRTLPGEGHALALAEVNAILARLQAEDPTFSSQVTTRIAREPFEVPVSSEVVQVVAAAAREVTGAPAPLVGAPYWTDAALVAAAGIPTVIYGPRGGGIHQSVEWVELESVEVVRRVLIKVATAICGA